MRHELHGRPAAVRCAEEHDVVRDLFQGLQVVERDGNVTGPFRPGESQTGTDEAP